MLEQLYWCLNSTKKEKNLSRNKKNATFANLKRSGIIAQSVEQRTENPCVAGSIPADTTKNKSLLEKSERLLFLCV
jgi:hypothetical protein